jgi:hypothetical protein
MGFFFGMPPGAITTLEVCGAITCQVHSRQIMNECKVLKGEEVLLAICLSGERCYRSDLGEIVEVGTRETN